MLSRASLMASRAALRAPRAQPLGARGVHFENVIGDNTPFSYANPAALGAKMVAFCGLGFATPFIACAYQINKASA